MYFYSINENKVDLFVYPVVIKKKEPCQGAIVVVIAW